VRFFNKRIEEELRKAGGRVSMSEFRRIMGINYKVRKEEFPALLKDLRRNKHFRISRRQVRLR
jgi:hypothetical protein